MKIWLLVGSGVSFFLAVILMVIGLILIMMARKKGMPGVADSAPMPLPVPVGNPDYAQPGSYSNNPDYAPQPAYSPQPAYAPTVVYSPPPVYTPPVPTGTADQPLPTMINDTQPPATNLGITEFAPMPNLDRTMMSTEPVVNYGRLICTSGRLLGQRFDLGSSGVVIGRERTLAQIVVEDPRVSKKHVWVGDRSGEAVAVDQGSTNGTFLNAPDSPRITEAVLRPGDVLIISDDVARFEYER